MNAVIRIMLALAMVGSIVTQGIASSKKSGGASQETLNQYMDDLKKNPADAATREKIIKLVLTMKPAPAASEEAERHMARGTAFASKAVDGPGYKKAIVEFEAAANLAPWMPHAYFNLGVVQEKAGYYAEALQSLKFYLMAAPDAKNAREVKNKIYALEVDAEVVQQASKSAPAAVPSAPSAPAAPVAPSAPAEAAKSLPVMGKTTLEIEPEKQLNIIKMPPPEKKTKLPSFIGSWYFKDTLRGEELTLHAFDISKNANGDIIVTPPKRGADSYATVNQFDINEKTMKLQMKWKMKSVASYWKTETYDLTLSEDGKTLSGTHNQRSIGGRNVDVDRTLFRQ